MCAKKVKGVGIWPGGAPALLHVATDFCLHEGEERGREGEWAVWNG